MAADASTAAPSGSPGAWSRSIWAPRWPSNVRYGCRPTASPSTRNNPIPPSGNFALTMMLEPSMLAPVLSQPSLPLDDPAGLEIGPDELAAVRRRLQRERTLGLDYLSEWGGIVIWVRVRSPEKEAEAQEILLRHGAQAVHIHEIELAKMPEDIPLASLRPDPWLGDERLGQP